MSFRNLTNQIRSVFCFPGFVLCRLGFSVFGLPWIGLPRLVLLWLNLLVFLVYFVFPYLVFPYWVFPYLVFPYLVFPDIPLLSPLKFTAFFACITQDAAALLAMIYDVTKRERKKREKKLFRILFHFCSKSPKNTFLIFHSTSNWKFNEKMLVKDGTRHEQGDWRKEPLEGSPAEFWSGLAANWILGKGM